MDTDYYRDKLVFADHLNTDTYIKIDTGADKLVFKQLKILMEKHKNCLTHKEFTYITNYEWKTSNFYVTPKIHKSQIIKDIIKINESTYIDIDPPVDLKGRPIIAGPASPTQHLSELLDKILAPLVPLLPSYIKDDWDLLRKFPRKIDYDCDLYTCDVISLYTNISHELGERALTYYIDRYRDHIPLRFSKQFIIESAMFVLKNNNFLFDQQTYHQVIGAAMGTIFAPSYACLSVGFLEETKLYPQLRQQIDPNYIETVIKMFKRYIDDGIIPWPREIDMKIFVTALNNLDQYIKFTIEKAVRDPSKHSNTQSLAFLDISFTLDELNQIETDIHYKETNAHDYLHYTSHHPQHIKSNIPFNLAKRIIVFCSDFEVEKMRLMELRQWLINSGYPNDIITKAFHNARLQGPAPKPINNKALPLITTFSSNYDCSHMSKQFQKLLSSSQDARMKEVFSETRTLLALRQPPNILTQITRAEFVTNPQNPQDQGGLYKCKSKKCVLCRDYIQECRSFFTASNTQWHIRSTITCNSRNVIYHLRCLCCNRKVSYTGRTVNLRYRMNNHISECRTGNTTDIFDRHVFKCRQSSSREEPYFEILAFIRLKESYQLTSYEKHFHSLRYDTMNT